MAEQLTFSEISIGRKFITPTGVTYKKIDRIYAVPIIDANGEEIVNGATTLSFQKTKIVMELV